MEEKRELKNKKLKLEELGNVDGGCDIPSPYYTPPGGIGHNKPHFMCRCGFKTWNADEYASHIAQNPEHIDMRYGQ